MGIDTGIAFLLQLCSDLPNARGLLGKLESPLDDVRRPLHASVIRPDEDIRNAPDAVVREVSERPAEMAVR